MEHKQDCQVPLMFQLAGSLFWYRPETGEHGPKQNKTHRHAHRDTRTYPRIVDDFFCNNMACLDDDKLHFNWDIFPYFIPQLLQWRILSKFISLT